MRPSGATELPRTPISVGRLALFFIGSGFSAVAYQVILSRYVQLIVGGTAQAISALLVAFMLGMSIGSAVGGRLADRSRHPLRVHALAEAGIGLYCVLFPFLFPLFQSFYLEVAPPIGSAPECFWPGPPSASSLASPPSSCRPS